MSDAFDLLCALVLEDGRRWGEAAAPFQREDATAVLDQASATPYHFLTRPRGGSKTTDLAGVNLAVLLAQAPPRARLYGLAADEKQGRLLVDALSGFVMRTPELAGALVIRESQVVATRSGARLDILAADQASIWGLRPWLVTVDEIAQWHTTVPPQRCWEAVSTGAVKVPGSRIVVLTTAGDPAHWGRSVLEHASTDPLWRVHEVPGPPPWLDTRRLESERRRLPESSYRRLFLNEWAASEDRLANEDDIAACVTLDGTLDPQATARHVIGVDLGLTSDRTVAAICHGERVPGHGQGAVRVVLDRLQVWQGSRLRPVQLSTVEEWIETAARRYGRAHVRLDPWQAIGIAQRLKARGLSIDEFSFTATSVGRLAVTLLSLLRERRLALPDDRELLDELRNLRLRESTPGVYRLDHDRHHHDDRAVALALAATRIIERAGDRPLRTSSALRRLPQDPIARRLRATAGTHTTFVPGDEHLATALTRPEWLTARDRQGIRRARGSWGAPRHVGSESRHTSPRGTPG